MADSAIVRAYAEVCALLTAPGAEFEVCEVDVLGAPARVFRRTPANIGAILRQGEADFGDRPFVSTEDGALTFHEVFSAGRRFARRLGDIYGVRAGDHVGLAMRNRLEWFITYAALVQLGAVTVLLNSRDSAEQVAHAAQAVECGLVIADSDRAERLSAGGYPGRVFVVDDPAAGFKAMVRNGPELDAPVPDADPDAPAAIFFTSGTTGRPKGAVLTQRNFVNMAVTLRFLGAAGRMVAARQLGMDPAALLAAAPRPATLMAFPMFHISGVATLFGAMLTGGAIHLMRRWDPKTAIAWIETHRITAVSGPPMVLSDILDHLDNPERLSSVSSFTAGGQATPPSLIERISATLPRAGQSSGWGMTELSSAATSAHGQLFLSAQDACGPPLPLSEIQVRDEQGRVLPTGEAGDLWVRTGMAMRGYWNAPEANAAVFDAGRWLCTGDVGFLDSDGLLHVIDRKKDMVISGGENIYCAEVERVLAADHAFTEVAVFGVPDARLGERAIAAVTLREGEIRSEAAVQTFVRERVADYKVPKAVLFDLGQFPRNATGKVDKVALRKRYLARVSAPAE